MMNWSAHLRAGVCMTWALFTAVAPVTAETLSEVLVTAYRNSNLLQSNRYLVEQRAEDVNLAVAAQGVTVNFLGSLANNWRERTTASGTTFSDSLSANVQFNAELTLLDGGEGEAAVDAASAALLAARQNLIEVEQGVLLEAVSAYLSIIRNEDTLALEENNFRLIQTELKAAEDKFELGEITQTEVRMVEARLAATRSGLALRQGELEIAKENFHFAVGVYPGNLRDPPSAPEIPQDLEEALFIARQIHPSIRAGKFLVEMAASNLERARSADTPRLFLGGSVGTNRNLSAGTSDPSASLSLTFRFPIYSGGAEDSVLRQARANLQKAHVDLRQIGLRVARGVASAWARLEISQAAIVARSEQTSAAKLAFDGVVEEARFGLRSTLDILDAEQERLKAATELASAIKDRDLATYALLSSIGLLTTEHLGLDVNGTSEASSGEASG